MKKRVLLLIGMCLTIFLVFSCGRDEDNNVAETGAEAEIKTESSTDASKDEQAFPGFDTLAEAANPHAWAEYFPREFKYWEATEEMIETTYGGGGRREAADMDIKKVNYLELYPFLKINYAGFPFEKGYYRSRGHIHALTDVLDTERLPDWDKRPASCLACKSSDVVVMVDEYGDDFYKKPFSEVVGENTVSCLDCHDHRDASVKVQREWLHTALEHDSFRNIEPEGRLDLTCAQCHVNYYFDANTRKPTLPWSTGLTVEHQLEDYAKARRSDEWEHEITGALVAKIQHPEYELYHEGQIRNIHSRVGLGCTDCHMPVKKDEHGDEYVSHTWASALVTVEESCFRCHQNWGRDGIIAKTESVQGKVYEKQNRIGAELADFIQVLGEKWKNGELSDEKLEKARAIQREAQFYWDFIWVENSNGFHNWQEAHRVLDNAEKLIHQGMALLNGEQ